MDTKHIQEQFNYIAGRYDAHRKCFIPCFDDYYTRSVSLLKQYRENFSTIVDLGAGTGLLTKELYNLYNDAHFVLIDTAKEMLRIAEERFAGLDNFEFIVQDYVNGIYAGKCDLVCSALSIHHLEREDKANLYRTIYTTLEDNGCFLNLDQFIAGSGVINDLYDRWWYNYIDNSGITAEEKAAWLERKKLDRENTIRETMDMLRAVGFRQVECVYHFMKFGVILAIK